MVLLGFEAQVKARFSPFGDSANLDTRKVDSLRQMYHWLEKSFLTHPMELLGDMGPMESRFG
jgi:hypothetical protein